MAESNQKEVDDVNLKKVEFLWSEYQYRHGLCWRLLFQLTAVIVVVSILPYSHKKSFDPKWLAFFVLLIGLGVTILTIRRLAREIELWEDVKKRLNIVLTHLEIQPQVSFKKNDFKLDILIPLFILFVLQIGNILYLFYSGWYKNN